jgi:hypothetical protein
MAINQLGVVAPVPQQFEALITSSQTWQVPIGVKTVEYIIAGGGGSGLGRGGIQAGIYNVMGKASIPIIIGAKATVDGVTAGKTVFDNRFVAAGGRLTGSSAQSGDFLDLENLEIGNVQSNYPITIESPFSSGTTANFRNFAVYDNRGIAISSDGVTAMVTSNSGGSWIPVTSITGDTTNFANIRHDKNMIMHHNGNIWILYSDYGSWYAYSTGNGTEWVTVNYGSQIRSMVATSGTQAVLVSSDRHAYTSNITTTAFSNTNSSRGDVVFTVSNSTVYSFKANGTYHYSSNSGATFQQSSQSFSLRSASSLSPASSTSRYTAVVNQQSRDSSAIVVTVQDENNNNRYWHSIWYPDTSGGGSVSGPYDSGSSNLISNVSMRIVNVRHFDAQKRGVFPIYQNTANGAGNMTVRQGNHSSYYMWNFNDGSLTGTNFNMNFINGADVGDVSRYVMTDVLGFQSMFADGGSANGFIHRAVGAVGHGVTSQDYNNNRGGHDALGTYYESSTMNGYGSGIDGWGRTSTNLNGLGYGAPLQNGAVRLRWVA